MSTKTPLHVVEMTAPRGWNDIDDDDLMFLASGGRQDAFETLVRRHQTLVLALASRFLGNNGLGRDVAQDVFLSLWSERKRYRAQGRFRSYLVSVTLNRCHAVVRANKNYVHKMASLARESATSAPSTELPLECLLEREKALQVRHVLTMLPKKHRQALILRFTHGFALEEISELTKTPLGTVKTYIFRGLKKLRTLLPRERSK